MCQHTKHPAIKHRAKGKSLKTSKCRATTRTTSFSAPSSAQSPNPDRPRGSGSGNEHPNGWQSCPAVASQQRQALPGERQMGIHPISRRRTKETVCGPSTFPHERRAMKSAKAQFQLGFTEITSNSSLTMPALPDASGEHILAPPLLPPELSILEQRWSLGGSS